jgi:hypothetical protein
LTIGILIGTYNIIAKLLSFLLASTLKTVMIALKKLVTSSFGGIVRVRVVVKIFTEHFFIFGIRFVNSHHAVLIIFAFDIELIATLLLLLFEASFRVFVDQAFHSVDQRLFVYLDEPVKWNQVLDFTAFKIKR